MSKPERSRELWERLIAAYSQQTYVNHKKASELAGCASATAWRIFYQGLPSIDAPPIEEVLAKTQAENRALRASNGDDTSLESAQRDARAVALAEGQMVAQARTGVMRTVRHIKALMDALEPVIEVMTEDIAGLADTSTDDEGKPLVDPRDRRWIVREVLNYQRQALKLTTLIMDLERRMNNEPAAVIGVHLTGDINQLVQQALEGAAALEHTASTLIDVSPDPTQH